MGTKSNRQNGKYCIKYQVYIFVFIELSKIKNYIINSLVLYFNIISEFKKKKERKKTSAANIECCSRRARISLHSEKLENRYVWKMIWWKGGFDLCGNWSKEQNGIKRHSKMFLFYAKKKKKYLSKNMKD